MDGDDIWWPRVSALEDLTIDEIESGFTLSAPDGTECADWLAHYNSTDELRERFNAAFVRMLAEYIQKLEQDGSKGQVPDGVEADREQAEEDEPRPVA
jgi:isopropylmalate/homocitrate/citramalate synthase